MSSRFLHVSLVAALCCAACRPAPTPVEAPPATAVSAATATNWQVYPVRGVIREVVSPTRARITHEEIPGYMEAMTMPLDAKSTNTLAGFKAGDVVAFSMVVTPDDGWIENVRRIDADPATITNAAAVRPAARLVREVEPLEVGQAMPDYPFTTEQGRPLRLRDLKGEAYAFTFIFTRCPFPTFCPRMSSHFADAAKALSAPGQPGNWRLLSISFDPEFDTPARLKTYAERYRHDPARWSFLTGAMIEIDAITEQFGLGYAGRGGLIDHNLRTVVVDASGEIQRILTGNEWTAAELAEELRKGAGVKPPQ